MRPHLTYADVVATLALVLAVSTGGAFAASKVIDGRSIKAGSVRSKQLGSSAVTSAKVENGSLTSSDFRKGTLKAGPAGPAGAAGSVGPVGPAGTPGAAATLSPSSVGAAELKADAVTGAKIADGSLTARDVARFAGTVELAFAALPGNTTCARSTSSSLTSVTGAQEDLRDDVIVVTPASTFPDDLTVTARPAGANLITVVACGSPASVSTLGIQRLRYATFDVSGS